MLLKNILRELLNQLSVILVLTPSTAFLRGPLTQKTWKMEILLAQLSILMGDSKNCPEGLL
jgi:hypothetical protein